MLYVLLQAGPVCCHIISTAALWTEGRQDAEHAVISILLGTALSKHQT